MAAQPGEKVCDKDTDIDLDINAIKRIRAELSRVDPSRRQAILRFIAETESFNPYADQFAAQQQRAGLALMSGLGAQRANTR